MNHHNSCINHHKWNIWNLQDLAMVINGMIYSSSWLWKGWFLCLPQFSDLTFPCLIECKSTSSPRRCASWEIVRCATQDWTSQPCPSTQGMKGSRSPGCRLQVGDSSTLISWVWVWIFLLRRGRTAWVLGTSVFGRIILWFPGKSPVKCSKGSSYVVTSFCWVLRGL